MIKRRKGFRRSVVRLGGLVAVLTAGLVAASATAAWAGQVDPPGDGGSGYTVSVHVSYSGDAAPASGGEEISVKAACYWAPAGGPYTDAVAMLAWYNEVTGGVQSPGMTARYGPIRMWQDAVAKTKAGDPQSWYMAACMNPADYPKYLGETSNPDPGTGATTQYIIYRAFPSAVGPPAPQVDPADLARQAENAMVIPDPVTNHNPTITSANGDLADATLVDLPTWFWVTNAAAVGGDAGTRFIRAQVDGQGGAWAEVTARTEGLSISSNGYGSATCSPAQALTAYAKNAKEGNACTVSFSHASTGSPAGLPVTFSTAWTATWVGSGGTGGTLDGKQVGITVPVQVAEVQNVNTQ